MEVVISLVTESDRTSPFDVLRAYLEARATFSDADFDGMRAVFVWEAEAD
jgi:predicted kinase